MIVVLIPDSHISMFKVLQWVSVRVFLAEFPVDTENTTIVKFQVIIFVYKFSDYTLVGKLVLA